MAAGANSRISSEMRTAHWMANLRLWVPVDGFGEGAGREVVGAEGCEFEAGGEDLRFQFGDVEESDSVAAGSEGSAQCREGIDVAGNRGTDDTEMGHGRSRAHVGQTVE